MKRLMILTMVLCCGLLVDTRRQEMRKDIAASPRHFEVRMRGGNSFDPPMIEIKVGDTITWINDDDSSFHTATCDDGTTFDTKRVESLSHSDRINKFTAAGTYFGLSKLFKSGTFQEDQFVAGMRRMTARGEWDGSWQPMWHWLRWIDGYITVKETGQLPDPLGSQVGPA
jgi:plastocyanin